MYLHKLYLRYSASCGERESRPIREEPETFISILISAPGAFCYALSSAGYTGMSAYTGQES